MDIFFSFSSPENVEKVWGLLRRRAGLGPQCFSLAVPGRWFSIFWRSPLGGWELEVKIRKIENSKNSCFFVSVASLCAPCFVVFCVFLYGPFCHGAHKFDLSTLFTTFFLWTSLPFIFLLKMWKTFPGTKIYGFC